MRTLNTTFLATAGIWMSFAVPFEVRPTHYFNHYQTHLVLCDYASAGNGWNSDNRLRVWLPQPLFLRQAFPADTWRLMCPGLKECPTIPKSAEEEEGSGQPTAAMPQVNLTIAGDWSVEVKVAARDGVQPLTRTLAVAKPTAVSVAKEQYASLDAWNVGQPGWARRKLLGLEDGICSSRFALVPGTVSVAPANEPTARFRLDEDFKVDLEWGAIGRIPEGAIGPTQAVVVSYQFTKRRLDSVVLNRAGQLELRQGEPHLSMPVPPLLTAGELRVANVFVPENLKQLGPANLFPILETRFPEPPKPSPSEAERRLPRTMAKLRNGEPLKLLAWGDSVTQGYLGEDQWQNQLVRRLQQRFPSARIELVTVGWGGHNSQDFLDAPPGHVRNFAESVLAAKPDLVISEFVNDVPLDASKVEQNYRRFLADFRAIGAEWVILTPHYSTFMNWPSERDLDDDPRPYVQMLRRFTREQEVALADAAARYGRLWRQGIPYSTLMVNACNHPDARGMAIFADSLMALFP